MPSRWSPPLFLELASGVIFSMRLILTIFLNLQRIYLFWFVFSCILFTLFSRRYTLLIYHVYGLSPPTKCKLCKGRHIFILLGDISQTPSIVSGTLKCSINICWAAKHEFSYVQLRRKDIYINNHKSFIIIL